MLALCESVHCRRAGLLSYFGEAAAQSCGNCDTCLEPPASWEGTVPAQKLLSTVLRLERERGQSFGAGQCIDILLGRETERVTQFRHHELSVFGVGADLREAEWRAVVRQLLARGLLAVKGEYGTLALTDRSAAVLRGDEPVHLRREAPRARTGRTPTARQPVEPTDPQDAPLFERLRAWRAGAARELGVPAYVVFHDATLRQIAALRPATLAELGSVSGVGENKLAKFGTDVLAVVAAEV
jgi:ATP-dependent DNA helicase RecQ